MASFTQKQRKHIATSIRKNIEKMGINGNGKQYLAKEFDISAAVVSQWMSGKKTPDLVQLYRMTKIFNIPFHQLCGLPKPSSKCASDTIIKVASCKSQSEKLLFHDTSRDNMDPVRTLIFNILGELLRYANSIADE